MSNCCPELDNPPSKSHMGVVQIIELVIMGVIGILSLYDFIALLRLTLELWTILSLIVDGLIIAGLVFIIIGLFCVPRYLKIGIYCFFGATIIAVVSIVWTLIASSNTIEVWLVGIIKLMILVFLAYVLWRQSKNV